MYKYNVEFVNFKSQYFKITFNDLYIKCLLGQGCCMTSRTDDHVTLALSKLVINVNQGKNKVAQKLYAGCIRH